MNRIIIAALAAGPLAVVFNANCAEAQSAEQVQAGRAAMAEWTKSRNYAAPANAPYSATDVSFRTPAGITLAGTFTLPLARSGRIGAVITVTGSGGQDRDSGQPDRRDYQLFREIADTLSRSGIAVLRLDDRGMGGSDLGPLTVTTADFADDIRAGIEWLRAKPEIDPARIVIVGHSEGGIIAPMIAATDASLAGIVIMGGTASTGRAMVKLQQEYAVDSLARLTGPARAAALEQSARATEALAAKMPWFRFFMDYDPTPAARKVTIPTLILHGDLDYQVPVAEAERLAAVMRGAGNKGVSVRTFARTNHLFTDDAGAGLVYAKLPSMRVRREVLAEMVDWLTATIGQR